MKKAIGIVILCASAAFAGTSIDPMDPNITNLAFCITNNASASIAPSHSTSADSNISLLSEDLIRDGFTIAATNFAWISSSTTNSLDIVAWRNVGNINTVYLITCRHHSAHTNEVRTVLLRDAEFGNTVATALNENFHWGTGVIFNIFSRSNNLPNTSEATITAWRSAAMYSTQQDRLPKFRIKS